MFLSWWQSFFRISSPKEEALENRRASVRHPLGRVAFCEVIALPENIPALVILRDISEHGLGLLCQNRLEVGVFLALKLKGPREFERLVRARIVHATPRDNDWLLGCTLVDRLHPTEVQALF